MAPEISILLATYNGGQYLSEQLESILMQSCKDWQLIIRDDGSCDNTLDVVNEYAQQYPEKIRLIADINRSVEASQNFSRLLRCTDTDYIMFCDQDDVWLSEKISKTLSLMKSQEQQYSPQTPLLVFTDKYIVDQNLNRICDSCFKYQNLNPQNNQLRHLLVQNVASGCTMMLNRSLVDLCSPIPSEAVMHDHWVSLTATIFGKIIYLDEPTVLYRQHDRNYYGASNYGWGYFLHRYHEGIDAVRDRFYQNVTQATTLRGRFSDRLQPEFDELLKDFSSLRECSWMKRRRILIRHQILKTGFRRNIGMFLVV